MSSGENVGLAAVAWLVAAALACAAAGAAFGVCCYRRARQTETRLRSLEGAVADFCGALRARLMLERDRLVTRGVREVSGCLSGQEEQSSTCSD